MRKRAVNAKFINNSRGMISAEFIFALTLCAGVCMVFFALTFTLSMAEVAQYITYSTARAHAAGHIDADRQNLMGLDKYQELLNRPVLRDLFANKNGKSWFSLSAKPTIKSGIDGAEFTDEYSIPTGEVPLTGARVEFKPALLNMRIAFIGSTAEDPDAGFQAYLTSFMIREPSQVECQTQIKARGQAILNLSKSYTLLGGSSAASKYIPMEDNGC